MSKVLTVLTACAFLAFAPAAGAQIQPGAYHETDAGSCTFNFAYSGGGETYMGTAAHCVEAVGQPVRDEAGRTVGEVALIGDEAATETDWAFVRILPAYAAEVSAAMKGNPTYPRTGFTRSGETSTGDRLQYSGYGLGFDLTAPTRERRFGLLTYDDEAVYTTLGTLIFGDSGGPIVHVPTGKALGIVSRLCIGLCEEEGPTVEAILSQAAAKGLPLTLRTV
jgi:hypothetical protein